VTSGARLSSLRLTYLAVQPQPALFVCQSCGHAAKADDVASINIFSRGIEVLRDQGQDKACGGNHSPDRP
jgi:hypothetical protein